MNLGLDKNLEKAKEAFSDFAKDRGWPKPTVEVVTEFSYTIVNDQPGKTLPRVFWQANLALVVTFEPEKNKQQRFKRTSRTEGMYLDERYKDYRYPSGAMGGR